MQVAEPVHTNTSFDVERIRADFPILHTQVYGKPLVYFDNGATAQKPQQVIDSIIRYYQTYNANVHRGVHFLSQVATDAHEEARHLVQTFINAQHTHEVIFTRGTTDSVNLVASSFGDAFIAEGDEIIITQMEHHSNFVPWQMLAERKKAVLHIVPILENGTLDMQAYQAMLSPKTKLVSVVHVSNTLGTVNDIKTITQQAHSVGAAVMVDGAQSIQHFAVDVQALDADFFCFSGHKLFGPTGIGVLYGKESWLNAMPPYQSGGSMIKQVTVNGTTFNDLPFKFEAGTPHIEGIIGLGEAIKYVNAIGLANAAAYEAELLAYATNQLLEKIPNARVIGTADDKVSVLSFIVEGIHPYDIGVLLDKMGIAVRTGHHCTQPVMDYYGIPGTVRASFAFYNTFAEVDSFIAALQKAVAMLG